MTQGRDWGLGTRDWLTSRIKSRIPNPQSLVSAAFLTLLLAGGACGHQQAPPPSSDTQDKIAWATVGSWSGRDNKLLESFESEGTLRITWETKAVNPPSAPATFRLTVHSAISGRPLMVAVDHKGPGAGTAFVSEEPRVFYAVVDSQNLDWSFTVEERIN